MELKIYATESIPFEKWISRFKFYMKDFLFQQKRFLLNRLFQITQFDNERKSLFKEFHHICFINQDAKNLPQLSFVDI
jgi:hypothetical protein